MSLSLRVNEIVTSVSPCLLFTSSQLKSSYRLSSLVFPLKESSINKLITLAWVTTVHDAASCLRKMCGEKACISLVKVLDNNAKYLAVNHTLSGWLRHIFVCVPDQTA